MNEQPTYKDITTYSQITEHLQDFLKREGMEAEHIKNASQDDAIDFLHSIENDLLFMADKIKVIAQDVIVGAIVKDGTP